MERKNNEYLAPDTQVVYFGMSSMVLNASNGEMHNGGFLDE